MNYKIIREKNKVFMSFDYEGKTIKLEIPRNCPRDFIESIYKARIRSLDEEKITGREGGTDNG